MHLRWKQDQPFSFACFHAGVGPVNAPSAEESGSARIYKKRIVTILRQTPHVDDEWGAQMPCTVIYDPATMVSVKTYGATGDGTTDDTVAIQRAENAALAVGKTLFFEPGTYRESTAVKIFSGTKILADPGSVTIQGMNGNTNLLSQAYLPGTNWSAPAVVSDISISGIVFDGGLTAQNEISGTGPILTLWRASNISFSNDTFQNQPGMGVLLSNVDHTGFANCEFSNIGYIPSAAAAQGNDPFSQGVAFCCSDTNASVGNYVTGCSFTEIGLDAVSATEQSGMTITGNVMTGLDTEPPSYWDTKNAGSAGIYLANDQNTLIDNNKISDASGNGIDIVNSSGLYLNANDVSLSGGGGIVLYAVNTASITNNIVTDNNRMRNHFFAQAGITIADRVWDTPGPLSSNIWIYGNTITDDQAVKTQNWALQDNVEAAPPAVLISANNDFLGNLAPDGLGAAGVAQAYVSANGQIQTAYNTAGGVAWSPAIKDDKSISVSLGSGKIDSSGATYTSDPILRGSGNPYSLVKIIYGTVGFGEVTTDQDGNWVYLASDLSEGLDTVFVNQTNLIGTESSASIAFIYDGLPPSLTVALCQSVSGSSPETITSDDSLHGTSAPGARLLLTEGTLEVGTTWAGPDGTWEIKPSGLADGPQTVTVSATDNAGVTLSKTISFTLDTAPDLVTVALNNDAGTALPGGTTSGVTLTGTADPGSLIILREGALQVGTTTTGPDGSWKLTPTGLPAGLQTVTVSETDIAGNVGSATIQFAYSPPPAIQVAAFSWKSRSYIGGLSLVTTPSPLGTTINVYRSASAVGRTITAADALAALDLAVGKNPNPKSPLTGIAPMVSPYQFLAADVNGDGKVTAADALQILRMAAGLPGSVQPKWEFVDARTSYWDPATNSFSTNRESVPMPAQLTVGSTEGPIALVGVLTGDVLGSWTQGTGSLDSTSGSVTKTVGDLAQLSREIGAPLDQWGITSYTAASALEATSAGTLTGPFGIADTGANIAEHLDALTSAKLGSLVGIWLTDNRVPEIDVTASQVILDSPVLSQILGNGVLHVDGTSGADRVDLSSVSLVTDVELHGNTASVSSGLAAGEMTFSGAPDVVVIGDGATTVSVGQEGGIEEVLGFRYGIDSIDIASAPNAAGSLIALDTIIEGQSAVYLTGGALGLRGVALFGSATSPISADLVLAHTGQSATRLLIH
jgi:parallel beta-helix repeat protein